MREQKGITLIVITLTVIVMLIIASITVYYGTDLIQNAKLQDLKTNMLLIQAKTKSGVEEVNFQSQNINDGSSLEQIKSKYGKDKILIASDGFSFINRKTEQEEQSHK